eukprot:1301046-Amphidinium_carterae.1
MCALLAQPHRCLNQRTWGFPGWFFGLVLGSIAGLLKGYYRLHFAVGLLKAYGTYGRLIGVKGLSKAYCRPITGLLSPTTGLSLAWSQDGRSSKNSPPKPQTHDFCSSKGYDRLHYS